jgi:hypothetical protein
MQNMESIGSRCRSFGPQIFGLCAVLLAGQASAEPQRLSSGPSASWELVQREGDRQCVLRTKILGSADLDTIDVDRSLGGRKVELRLHGPRSGKEASSTNAGYAVGNGIARHQLVIETDGADGRRSVELEFIDDEAAAIAQGSPVSLAVTRRQVITVYTKGLVALLPALDACSRNDLIEPWRRSSDGRAGGCRSFRRRFDYLDWGLS